MKKLFKGFTLIELLIVIAIIGILAVALLPSVLGAPARARDAARKADINNIVAAIESYNSDNQKYPATKLCIGNGGDADLNSYFQGGKSPSDPQGASSPQALKPCAKGQYLYCPMVSPNNYFVAAVMEIKGDGPKKATVVDCSAPPVSQATVDGYAAAIDGDTAYVITK